MECESGHGQHGSKHLDELYALRDPGLVEAVGKFAAEGGQDKVRADESGAGELRERRSIGFGNLNQDQ